jgi:hypothetical protein
LGFNALTFPGATLRRCRRTFPTFPGGVKAMRATATFEDELPASRLMLDADARDPEAQIAHGEHAITHATECFSQASPL